jgi:hypothetical protein
MTAPPTLAVELPLIRHELTPGQLDAALSAADWPTWTGRDGARGECPLTLAEVPRRLLVWVARRQMRVPDSCLRVAPIVGIGDWLELLVELTAVAPDAVTDIVRRGLVRGEVVPGEGYARYLLGLTVTGAAS